MGDDYLKVFIIYDGKMEDLDAAQTVGLITRIKPKVRALNINNYVSCGFVEKSEWESLSEVPICEPSQTHKHRHPFTIGRGPEPTQPDENGYKRNTQADQGRTGE